MPKQLRLPFDHAHRGTNYKPPRLRTSRNGRGQSHTRWEIWCGWCRSDHRYNKRFTQEQVAAMHADHIENICKVRARGDDPFG